MAQKIVFGTGELTVNDDGELLVSGGSGGSGDASAANQDEQTALLTTIDTDTGDISTKLTTTNTEIGATNESAAANESATVGLNGLLKAILAKMRLSNNGAPPAANTLSGAMTAVANAADPIFTEGRLGLLSMTLAGYLRSILGAGEAHVGAVGGHTAMPAASQFTRPSDTTAYASGDLVANSTTPGSVAALQFTVARVAAGSGVIRRARIKKSGTGVTNASFRLHLYLASPGTITNGDNGAFSTSGAGDYMGAFDVTVDRVFTDGADGFGVPVIGSEISFKLSSGQIIYGLLEARAAYSPGTAETFNVSLEVFQD